jgi:tRNA (Thr-GGU) A37 N-methylase
METYTLTPIGTVRAGRRDAVDDHWDEVAASIELDADVLAPEATLGLDAFSHVEVIFVFHQVEEADLCRGARRPRGNPAWPVTGILAQRPRMRPNRLGTTVCRLLGVDGLRLDVHGLDALDGTPVIDVKPYFSAFGPRGAVREPAWVHELIASYWSAPEPDRRRHTPRDT